LSAPSRNALSQIGKSLRSAAIPAGDTDCGEKLITGHQFLQAQPAKRIAFEDADRDLYPARMGSDATDVSSVEGGILCTRTPTAKFLDRKLGKEPLAITLR
jgi:hypothetical protein